MLPVLGHLAGEPIPAYFSLVMVAFGAATLHLRSWALQSGLPSAPIVDAALAAVIFGVVGARVLHVLADGYFWDYVNLCIDPNAVTWAVTQARCTAIEGAWDAKRLVCHAQVRDCFAWAKFYQGGLVYYGGLFGGAAGALWVLRRDRMPLLRVADAAAPGLAFGLCLGRIGCFLGGCCFGRPTRAWVGMRFPGYSPASEAQFRDHLLAHPGMVSLPVHPTQLYEALGCLLLAAGLRYWASRHQRFVGQSLLLFLSGYALLRGLIELVRDDDRGALWGLSTSQWIGLGVLVGVAYAWRGLRQRAFRADGRARRSS